MRSAENGILQCLASYSFLFPDKIAFIILEDGEEKEQKISYQALETRIKVLAQGLYEKKLEGKRVILFYQDILEFIVSFLACQYAGIIAVPVPYVKGNRQFLKLFTIMEDVQAAAILCTAQSVTHLQATIDHFPGQKDTDIISTSEYLAAFTASLEPVCNKISFIQYTSGSTGKPKGVVISVNNLVHNQQLIKSTFGCDESSVIFSWLPFHHDMGLIGNILHTIYVGCTGILMSPFHFMQRPQRWLEGLSRYKVTHSGGPNFAYDLCAEKIPVNEVIKLDLSHWKVAYNGSEPVRHSTLQRFTDHFKITGFNPLSFFPCYGLAEATLLVAGSKVLPSPATISIAAEPAIDGRIILADAADPKARCLVSSGAVASGMEVKIFSSKQQPVSGELEEGEICISGESVTAGYWNRDSPYFFEEVDGKRFLRTGDLGFYYKGELFVHGRLKEILIVRGKNIYPYDIEQAIADSHTSIEANGVAVFSLDNSDENIVVVAEIKRSFARNADTDDIIGSIEKIITGICGISPHDIVLTTPLGIPRTTSGKLQRVKCRESYRQNDFSIIGSRSRLLQRQVKKDKNSFLLQQVTGYGNQEAIKKYMLDLIAAKAGDTNNTPLEDHTPFTDLGIDSLRTMELINTINRDLDINLDISILSADNTLSGFIHAIENMLWLKNSQPSGKGITI